MRNAIIAVAVVLVGGLAYLLLRQAPAAPPVAPPDPGVEVIRAVKVEPLPPVAAPVTPPSVIEADAGGGAAPTAMGVAPMGAPVKPAGPSITPTELADLKLDRTLTGDHTFTQAGRLHAVLGTKNAPGPTGGTQALLVTRDQVSGQIAYSLSALQFTLNAGTDPEAFISEHPHFHKRFVNPLYLQVDVDAADIASELEAAAHDTRVAKVGFIPPPVVKSPR